jgi:tRNA uridine 5-carboxymethylaminomethyl modification enzyme
LEHCEILKWSYQIEYDAVKPLQFAPTLQIKKYQGLYGAGQICGTSGYEEAAGLGLMAGINAALWIKGQEPLILRRDESYIGVMIDDLVTKGTEEPYRLMSSRAEFRLLLRHDNADLRLMKYGYRVGLVSPERYAAFEKKYSDIKEAIEILGKTTVKEKGGFADYLKAEGYTDVNEGHRGLDLLKRPNLSYRGIAPYVPELKDFHFDEASVLALETKVKYEGYIEKELREAKDNEKLESIKLPTGVDYTKVDGLALEARQKLNEVQPLTIGQASRISGVNPADVSILILTLRKKGLL